ncbi:MAG: sigma-E processing peptidase SpoIIGA [Gorillibacterium sp.]|nr:sigma-E processing peptidase SpoIIGA [Gorillibacterium sp.]
MIVYLDLLFLINFLIDGSLLLVTAWTTKTRYRKWRLALSAIIGALYVVFVFYPSLSFLYTLSVKVIFSLIMIFTAFGFVSLRQYARHLGVFYLINFAAAGGVFALSYFLLSSDELLDGIVFSRLGGVPVGTGVLSLLLIFMVWLFYRVFNSVRVRQRTEAHLAEVQVDIGDFVYCCQGLVDTGNQLYDPLTRTPVMIIEASEWKDVVPEAWLPRIRSAEADRIIAALGEDDFLWQDRLRLVPFRGVNRGTQFLLALKPDRVIVRYGDKVWETGRVLVGLDGGKLSSDGSYHAIIHPMLLEA